MRTRALASAGALSLVVSSHERIRAYVELKGGDIVVTLPGADYSVTYFKPERDSAEAGSCEASASAGARFAERTRRRRIWNTRKSLRRLGSQLPQSGSFFKASV